MIFYRFGGVNVEMFNVIGIKIIVIPTPTFIITTTNNVSQKYQPLHSPSYLCG
jgi:hypothetical protein